MSDHHFERMSDHHFRVKRIPWNGGVYPILLQEANGPCPLLGLANVIALLPFGGLKLSPNATTASLEHVLSIVAEFALASLLKSRISAPENEARVHEFISILPDLFSGVSLDPRLASPLFDRALTDTSVCKQAIARSFAFDGSTSIYDVINIQLVHAWIVSPTDLTEEREAMGLEDGILFSKAQEMLVALDAAEAAHAIPLPVDSGSVEGGAAARGDGGVRDPSGAAAVPEQPVAPASPDLPRARAIKQWLHRYPTHATPYGVLVLTALLRDLELACLCECLPNA
jgi:hypothetical protein